MGERIKSYNNNVIKYKKQKCVINNGGEYDKPLRLESLF